MIAWVLQYKDKFQFLMFLTHLLCIFVSIVHMEVLDRFNDK